MLSLYRKRIQELEDEVLSLGQQKSGEQADISTLELLMRFRRDHIARYRGFIERASAIIESSKKRQGDVLKSIIFYLGCVVERDKIIAIRENYETWDASLKEIKSLR
jgi:hypothetical protein